MNAWKRCAHAAVALTLEPAGCGEQVELTGNPLDLQGEVEASEAAPALLTNKVLILATTVTGGINSDEYLAVRPSPAAGISR